MQGLGLLLHNHLVHTEYERGFFNERQEEIFTIDQVKGFYQTLLYSLSFEKPTGHVGPAKDDTDEQDVYYKEREWRIIAQQASVENGVMQEIEGRDYIPFTRDDIRIIIVPSNDIQKMVTDYLYGLKGNSDSRLNAFAERLPPVISYDDLKFL